MLSPFITADSTAGWKLFILPYPSMLAPVLRTHDYVAHVGMVHAGMVYAACSEQHEAAREP